MTPISRPRQSWLAALLSFIVPGLGQAYLGHWPLGALLAVPFLLAVALVVFVATGDTRSLANQIVSSTFLIGVFALNIAILLWRLFAIVHAGLSHPAPSADPIAPRGSAWRDRGSRIVLAALLVAAVGMHAYVAAVVLELNDTLGQVFDEPDRVPPPAASGEEPEEEEPAYRWDGRERVNFLLIGVDEAPGREASLTDTILVLSVDPSNNSAVMVSVPRDTGFTPLADTSLYPEGLYPNKINSLAATAQQDPATFCPERVVNDDEDARRCGIETLQETVGLYLGIPIHYYARVDLLGFEQLIDAFGGVELCLPGRLVDPTYLDPASGERGLEFEAGCRHYSGRDALAYARSRQGYIELPDGTREQQNDFLRADRQQEILLALRDQLDDRNILFELPTVLDAVGATVSTDFPRAQAGDLATLVPLVTGPDIERVVLGYPDFVDLPADPSTNYLLTPRRTAVRHEMERLFGASELEGWYLAADDDPAP